MQAFNPFPNISTLNFSLDQLCDYRMHVAQILDSDLVDHTPESLALMRSAYAHNNPELNQIDFIEKKIRNTHRYRPRLHAEILASVLSIVRLSKPHSVLDIGCGEGLLVRALAQEGGIERIIGTDMDPRQLIAARAIIEGTNVPGDTRIQFLTQEELTAKKTNFHDIDLITLLEVIEHIPDHDWIDTVFAYCPKMLIVTTPNYTFNQLYDKTTLTAKGFRHPDHAFEFTHNEFLEWAQERASKHNYSMHGLQIGPSTLELGSSGQMAVFQRS